MTVQVHLSKRCWGPSMDGKKNIREIQSGKNNEMLGTFITILIAIDQAIFGAISSLNY